MSPDPNTNPDSDTTPNSDSNSSSAPASGISRRDYLTGMAGVTAMAGGYYGLSHGGDRRILNTDRFDDVYNHRVDAASNLPNGVPEHRVVDDVEDGPDGYLARFTRGLPHNDDLTVDDDVYETYTDALHQAGNDTWEEVERGGSRSFIDPNSATSIPMLGMDTHELVLNSPPALDSEDTAADMTELYWMSLLRDVPFVEYPDNELAQAAAADLSRFDPDSYPTARDDSGAITPELLFRGPLPGSQHGPYMSQFMVQDAPFGAHNIVQRIRVGQPGLDFITDRETMFSDRNGTSLDGGEDGQLPTSSPDMQEFDDTLRYMRTGRDVTSCVQRDVVPGQFLIAVMVVLQRPVDGVPPNPEEVYDARNPEIDHDSVHMFVNYARTQMLDLMTRAGRYALMAAWFNKWQVIRRCRPSKVAAMIDLTLDDSTDVDYGHLFHDSLNDVDVLDYVYDERGNHILSSAYAEGEPYHPAYPGGHACVSAAAATIGKAMLNEDYVIPNPVEPTADGTELVPYEGDDAEQLTVGHELNKMIDNINIAGRQMAGVHYRSDYTGRAASYALGERVAIRLLRDVKDQTEAAAGFEFTSLDGGTVRI